MMGVYLSALACTDRLARRGETVEWMGKGEATAARWTQDGQEGMTADFALYSRHCGAAPLLPSAALWSSLAGLQRAGG